MNKRSKRITDKERLDWLFECDSRKHSLILISSDGGDSYRAIVCKNELDAAIKQERKGK